MNSPSLAEVLAAIEPFLLLIGGPLLALVITYWRRRQQKRNNPQIRFDKSIWKASTETFGAIVLIWAILYFLFPIQKGQVRFAPQIGWLIANPFLAIMMILFIPALISGVFIAYLLNKAKNLVYRGDYESALKFVRGFKWLPVMRNIFANLEGSILLMYGRYAEAEPLFSEVEDRTLRSKNKAQRQARGMNLGNLGWVQLRQKRYAEALETLQLSIELYPEGADNFNGLGETLLWMGKAPKDALEYLDRGVENKRYRMKVDRYVWGELLANRAWALAQLGSFDQALDTYRQALAETEQECIPALAGLHMRGAFIYRLMGDEPQAIGELNLAISMDRLGAYGQLAKAALDVQAPQEKIGMAMLPIAADSASVVAAIRRSTPVQRTIKVVRENLMLVAQGKTYSYLYLLRPQADGTTVLQALIAQTASVEAAINNPDLKAGLSALIADLKRTATDASFITDHLKAISSAVSQPAAPEQPATETPSSTSYDAAAVFARKPLPSVTAKDRPSGSLNPSWYASMSFVMTPLISSLVLSTFWRRLGKPKWMWLSMLCAILVPVVGVGGALMLARSAPPALQFSLILGGAGAWYGFTFALASVLEGPYQKWHQSGKEALANYPYKWGRAALIGVGTITVAMVAGTVIHATQPGPQKFDNDLMSLTYPPNWQVGNFSQLKSCKLDSECIAWFYESRYGFSNILFGRFSLNSTASATTVERNTWSNLTRQNTSLELDTRDTIKIGGMDAARRFYYYASSDPDNKELQYGMQIYMVHGQYAYYITGWSANKGIFEENRAAIEKMLESYVLKDNPDGISGNPVKWIVPKLNPAVTGA